MPRRHFKKINSPRWLQFLMPGLTVNSSPRGTTSKFHTAVCPSPSHPKPHVLAPPSLRTLTEQLFNDSYTSQYLIESTETVINFNSWKRPTGKSHSFNKALTLTSLVTRLPNFPAKTNATSRTDTASRSLMASTAYPTTCGKLLIKLAAWTLHPQSPTNSLYPRPSSTVTLLCNLLQD